MLISAKQPSAAPLPSRTEDKTVGVVNELKAKPTSPEMQIQMVKASDRTMAVIAEHIESLNTANKSADRLDEAFAKTRVALQATAPSNARVSSDISAVANPQEDLRKLPEQSLRPNMQKEISLLDDDVKAF